MTTEDFKRKLIAILSADVKEYSRLMGDNEEATVKTITGYREVITTVIQKHRGRVVDSPGDNILAEFASVIDAVQSAVEIQREITERNIKLPENRRMEFRIGINLGDVIHEKERIYGDGVNVAARVEGIAEPGGICVSGTVFDQIENKISLGYEYLGEQIIKNIAKPVRVYRVLMDPESAGKVIGEKKVEPKLGLIVTLAVVILLLLIVGGLLIWRAASPPVEVASEKKMAFPLPEKPSLAVLPFDNLSGDSSQDYFSDGITETIISNLSNVSNLFVIARNSSFTYKGKPVKVQQVAEELGVRYVLEGSVQKSGDNVRITAQLSDALTGRHMWADQYDRKFGDIFELQNDITDRVVTALEVKLTEGEQARIRRGKTNNPEAYEYYLRGLEISRRFTKEDNAQARKLFEKAVEIDPDFAYAWQEIGRMHYRDARFGWAESPAESLKLAEELAQKTLNINDSDATAYATLSLVYMARREHEKAVAYGEKALELAPNFADVNVMTALSFYYSGRAHEAIELVKKAMRLSPYYPDWYLPVLGHAYRLTGQYKEAIDALEGWRERANPSSELPYLMLAFTYVEAGRDEDAHKAVEEILKRKPEASVEGYARSKFFSYKDPAEIERALDSLRKAGLPETPPLPLPDKASIAVLPFVNLSGDPAQEYIADGIGESIITALCKIPEMFVIARTSTSTYKGKSVKIQQVSEELGVRYVLEGSVQKSGDRIRLTAQLIDAITGHHLWADRYDRDTEGFFDVLDEISKKVAIELQVKLTEGDAARMSQKTKNFEAWGCATTAYSLFRYSTKENIAKIRELCEKAVKLDPNYAFAWGALGAAHWTDAFLGYTESRDKSLTLSAECIDKSLKLDETLPCATSVKARLYMMQQQLEQAIALGEKAIALGPSQDLPYFYQGLFMVYAGRFEEAIALIKKAMRLNPYYPPYYSRYLANASFLAGRYEEALEANKKALELDQKGGGLTLLDHLGLSAVYTELGREAEARAHAAEVIKANPKVSLENLRKGIYSYYKDPDHAERLLSALRKAGIPE